MQTLNSQVRFSLVFLFLSPFTVGASEIGVKGGYQLYSNDLGNPTSLGKGVFMNTPISDVWSLEGGLLLLGEAEEDNHNIGAFNAAELSALYSWELDYGELIGKAGVAPWLGYMTMPNGEQDYEYGLTAVLGAAYRFPLYGPFNGRVEYQFLPNLGGAAIGYTNSHFVSLGLSWRTDNVPLLASDSSPVLASPYADITQMPVDSHGSASEATPAVPHASSDGKAAPQTTRILYGTWLFNNNSSVLVVPKPFNVLDKARHLVSQGCSVSAIDVGGYADGTGEDKYNQWLSKHRAKKVAQYLMHALSGKYEVAVSSFGSERSSGRADVSFYERRVDFRIQCVEEK